MDQSIGNLRMGLRSMKLEENTLVWFNSDNGGLPNFGAETVGGLRGYKGKIYEGGLRVPCIIEWPAGIRQIAYRMIKEFTKWNQSVEVSIKGEDYPNGLMEPNGYNVHWNTLQEYRPYFKQWRERPEYKAVLKNEN